MKRSQIFLLSGLVGLILFIWLLPKNKPPGALKTLFGYTPYDVKRIEYKKDKEQNYTIEPYYIPHWGDEQIYWKVHSISKDEQKTNASFFATSAVDGMVNELTSLEYLYDIPNNVGKHEEYGLNNCLSYVKLDVGEVDFFVCLGKSNFNQTKKYFWPKNSDSIYLTTTYLFNRYDNNIFTRINKSLFFPDKQNVAAFTVRFSQAITRNYPLLFTNGRNILEFSLIESPVSGAWWKIKSQSDDISKQASSTPQLFSNFRLTFVATGEMPKSLGKPAVEVIFYKKNDKTISKKKSENYKLWNTPYPKNIHFVPHQDGSKNRQSHFVAASQHHWGVYPKYDLKRIKTELQYIEDAIQVTNKKRDDEKKRQAEEEKLRQNQNNSKQQKKGSQSKSQVINE